MSILRRLAEVREAQARAQGARTAFAAPVSSLLARARRRPLLWVAAAAGGGVVMGGLGWRVWRVPGVMALLSGEAVDLAKQTFAVVRGSAPTP